MGTYSDSHCKVLEAQEPSYSGSLRIGLCLISWGVGVFTIGGNLLTISGIVRDHHLRTQSNYYLASLAAADSLVGVLLLPLGLTFLPQCKFWIRRSRIGCLAFLGTVYASTSCSGIHMVFVSIDRYIYLTKPFLYMKIISGHLVSGSIALIWVVSILFGSLVFSFQTDWPVKTCRPHEVLDPAYSVNTAGVLHFASLLVTSYIYVSIMCLSVKLQKELLPMRHRLRSISKPDNRMSNNTLVTNLDACSSVTGIVASPNTPQKDSCKLQRTSDDPTSSKDKLSCPVSVIAGKELSSNPGHVVQQIPSTDCQSPVDAAHNVPRTAEQVPTTFNAANAMTSSIPSSSLPLQVLMPGSTCGANSCSGVSIPTSARSMSKEEGRKGSILHLKLPQRTPTFNSIRGKTSNTPRFSIPTSSNSANVTARETANPANRAIKRSSNSVSRTVSVFHYGRADNFYVVYWKAIRLFVYVFGFFVAVWLPFYVCVFLDMTAGVPAPVSNISGPFSLFNSGVNIFVYAMTSKDFRGYYKRTLCPCLRR